MREGQQVTYIGPETDQGLVTGDTGRLLVFATMESAHVQVHSGAVYLIHVGDLQTTGARPSDGLEDSLEVGGLVAFAVRETYEETGDIGVLNQMASLGHLTGFSEIAEEAIAHISGRIRQDPSFREVLAYLDDEEGEGVIRLAAVCLIRDAFGDDQ